MDEKAAPVRIEPVPEPPYVYHYVRPRQASIWDKLRSAERAVPEEVAVAAPEHDTAAVPEHGFGSIPRCGLAPLAEADASLRSGETGRRAGPRSAVGET